MGYQLFILVIIDLKERTLLHINATYNSNFGWIKQQFKDALFDLNEYPAYCICDNDTIFQHHFEEMLRDYFRIKLRCIPYNSPEKNGRTERFHLSLKSEAFKNVVPPRTLSSTENLPRIPRLL